MEHYPPLLDGLTAKMVTTPRLATRVIFGGPDAGEPVVLVHGNTATARAFEELMIAFPPRYRTIALDLRGYGRAEPKPVDATRGLRDFSDDLYVLVQTLGLQKPHLVGWSLGGNVAIQYAIDYPAALASLTLIAAGSPYGFGGTRDKVGAPTSPDFAGSGGGLVNQEFLKRLQARDRSEESPFSPRNVMNASWYKPPFRSPREDVLLDEMLLTAYGPDNYPGDFTQVATWPYVGPGTRGVSNTLSPKYCNQQGLADINPQPSILWVRGLDDQIVADRSLRDIAVLGEMGLFPDWPGPEMFPAQPMVSQLRAVLDRYVANGGRYKEVIVEDCGHSPHIEKPEVFNTAFFAFLAQVSN